MKVVLVRLGSTKCTSWFEKYKGGVFDVIRKQENGYEVNLSPCGYPDEIGFLYNDEVLEVADPQITSVKDGVNILETAAHYACASGHRFGPGTSELIKNLLEKIAKQGTDSIHRLVIAAAIHFNEVEKLEKQADYEFEQFQNFVRDIRKTAKEGE